MEKVNGVKKLLFIFNPNSGKGTIKSHLLNIINTFVRADYEVTVYPTQKTLDAKEKVISAGEQYDLIACSGGDGTLNEVVAGVFDIDKDIPIGYIPSGSTNDFAATIKLPKKMGKAADIIVNGRRFATDIGTFNGRPFVYIAAFGAFTDVSYGTPQNLKNMLGHNAYVLEGAKKLLDIKPYNMTIKWEQGIIEDEFIYGMVSNAKYAGGFKGITGKNVVLNDGKFEVTLIKKLRNPLDLNSVVTYLLGMSKSSERVMTFKTSNITFNSNIDIAWVLDGEFGGEQKVVEIINNQRAVQVMISADSKLV